MKDQQPKSDSHLKPWNPTGEAVVQADFGVFFDGMPSPAVVGKLEGLHPKVRSAYPVISRLPANEWVESDGMVPLAGLAFSKKDAGGEIVRRVRLSVIRDGTKDSALTVRRHDFKKWNTTWKEVREIYNIMLPVLLEKTRIRQVTLELRRRISWSGERVDVFRLFRKGNCFVSPVMFDLERPDGRKMFLDNRVAYLERPIDENFDMIINTVIVKLSPARDRAEPKELWVEIAIRQQCVFDRALKGRDASKPGRREPMKFQGNHLVAQAMAHLRREDGKVLAQVLSSKALGLIGVKEA